MSDSSASLTHKTLRGTVWSYVAFYGGKVMVFVSTVILARLLTKEDFGVAGYAIIVISFLEVANQLGIGAAVIYHDEDPEVADTAFWLGLGISMLLFAGTWFLAPFTGLFFNDDRAIMVTRVLALTFPIGALGHVHGAVLQKRLAFSRKFIPDVLRAASKGIISIVLAVLNFGYWSLIIGQIAGILTWVIGLWLVLSWRPSFRFTQKFARSILSYGTGTMALDWLAILLLNVDYLVIGRFLGAEALGVYTVAFRIPELVILQLCVVVARVVFPVYTRVRDDPEALRNGFLTTMRYVALITVPLGLGLMLVAEPFVLTMFTAKWVEAIPVMRAIALYALLVSISFNAGDIYKARGYLGIMIKLTLLELAILCGGLYLAITGPGTTAAVAWVHVVVALVGKTVNIAIACRIIDTPFNQVLVALRPAVLSGVVMMPVVLVALSLAASAAPLVQLVAGITAGALAYGGVLWLFQRSLVMEASQTLRAAFLKKRTG